MSDKAIYTEHIYQEYSYKHVSPIEQREEVVRCRDCKFSMSYWAADYCDYFSHVTNDPDGFCAWGERKEMDA